MRRELITCSSVTHRATVRFTAVATSLATAEAVNVALSTAYDGQAFTWTAGQCRAFRKLDSKVDEYGRPGPGGAMQYTASVEFETRLRGSF